ncbi:MAG: exo-alpha-sialidase [Bacteroidota bacterium]
MKQKHQSTLFYLLTIFFLSSSLSCSKKTTTKVTVPLKPAVLTAQVNTTYTLPVLTNQSANPYTLITIQVPQQAGIKKITRIVCSLNNEVTNDVEKIQVYQGGPVFTEELPLMATQTAITATIEIPVNLSLQAGTNYIWLNIRLKENPSLASKLNLKVNQLIDELGNGITIDLNTNPTSKYQGITLRKAGEDGINTYRIPGIITTDKGTLIAVYDNRYVNSADLPANIDVAMSRSNDGGKTWQAMKVIMDMGIPNDQNGIGDPSILFDPVTHKIWVAALWSKGNHSIAGSGPGLLPDETGQLILVNSSDDGLTWSAPINITTQVKNPLWKILFQGPGNGIAMQDGTLVFPAQYWDALNMPYSTFIYSKDQGLTWKRASAQGPKSNTTESQVVETTAGTLMLNMRDNRGGFRSVATTNDLGDNWVIHPTSYQALVDPVCMGSLIKARVKVNGALKDVLFFSNPNSNSSRSNITIKASLDMGLTWQATNQLLIDSRSTYGYSSLTKIDDQTIGILYEGTRDLYFLRIPVNDIIK